MPSPRATLSGARRTATASAVATVAGALLTTVLATPAGGTSPTAVTSASTSAVAASAALREDSGKRRIVRYRVRRGDTATGLAVHYHAWTAELIELNDLGPSGALVAGRTIRIPIVVDRAGGSTKKKSTTQRKKSTRQKSRRKKQAQACSSCRSAQPRRQQVRRVIARTARRHGVDPQLALAISWQESGWRMSPVSSAGAIGAMQVLPTTATWMSFYAGRPLRLRSLRDNATAGVLMLKVLRGMVDGRREVIAAYYQGPGAVQRHGIYPVSRPYVANVLAIKRALERGRQPG